MSGDNDDITSNVKLLELVKEAIERDNVLRKKYDIGDRFRFIRDRLHAFLTQLEAEIQQNNPDVILSSQAQLAPGEVLVHVYLYNANGLLIKNWYNMLLPKAFFEYSINRPIYASLEGIEAFIRAKTNKVQHGYLTVTIKESDIINMELQDPLGNKIIRIKEGALSINKLLTFSHNGQDYFLNGNGELIKK